MKLQSGMAVRLLRAKFFWSCNSSWWLNQPIWKICNRQIGSNFPNFRDENSKNIWETPPNLDFFFSFGSLSRETMLRFAKVGRPAPCVHWAQGTWKITLKRKEDLPTKWSVFSAKCHHQAGNLPRDDPSPPVKTTFGKLLSIWIQALSFLNVPHRSSFSRYGAVVEMPSAHRPTLFFRGLTWTYQPMFINHLLPNGMKLQV